MIVLPKREHLEKIGDRELDSLSRSHYIPVVRIVYRKRIEMIASLISEHPRIDTLLDIGYGVGMMFPELSRRCRRLYGVDRHDKFSIVKRMLARNAISSQLAVGDILRLGYKKASMDCIICASVLEHIRDLSTAMNEISEVLKEEGALILGFSVKNKITKLLFRLLGFNDEEIHPSSHTAILEEALRHFELEDMQQFPRFVPRDLALYIAMRLKKKGKGQSAGILESIQSKRKKEVSIFFDKIPGRYDFWHSKNKYYYQEIALFCSELIPQGTRVLEIGCATGDLLHDVAPETGAGIDLSP